MQENDECTPMLWFDVESRYKATKSMRLLPVCTLWFDVESRYKATIHLPFTVQKRCGLM